MTGTLNHAPGGSREIEIDEASRGPSDENVGQAHVTVYPTLTVQDIETFAQ